ncbi:single-stranded DNA-binding protein [Geosporobacter ferrireducens]|uniref:Single-stranded DNA-binding protein n=1 Tax=Geosporobacter ferrireducens TaxID=1424294 RepID=A0A1D8GI03_9FIRM|nr:single-stranded DNA-binding protein [Geosporobacter ferrireducens]AOT70527.1 single-stranded DNA-binding protein [Geosporobacter ferrireducens]MTI57117.1 single-stranded DNA-binding protein [Geosporobacter ferrireducens]
MNQVTLIGRLAKDPELRFTAGSGKAVATFTLAVDRPFAKEKEADFFRVVVWGKTGENCANYLAKGRLVAIQGRLQNNNFETQSGEKRFTTEVVADRVEFLEWGNKNENRGFNNPSNIDIDGFQAIEEDDDIPF